MITIAVTSQKGGVGKTTLAFNIAQILSARKNTKVLAIDNDPLSNLTSSFLDGKIDPRSNILAAYDGDGKIIRTVERFENIALPPSVRDAVAERFPGWNIEKDIFAVTYHDEKGVNKKYKLVLSNGDKKIRVKLDETGSFL